MNYLKFKYKKTKFIQTLEIKQYFKHFLLCVKT